MKSVYEVSKATARYAALLILVLVILMTVMGVRHNSYMKKHCDFPPESQVP